MSLPQSIAVIGFGEVGRIFARNLKAAGIANIAAYDLLFDDPGSGPSRTAREAGVRMATSAADAATGAALVFSAVTAAQTLDAAKAAAEGIGQGAWFVDLNSASPGTKGQAFEALTAAHARYVEAAVMTSVPPKGLKSQMLLGGPNAADFKAVADALGMETTVFSDKVGQASAVKMCRSVLIKGVEALIAESMLTAREYGVENVVLDSLHDLLPHPDWRNHARYMLSRSLIHGKRRAEEVREVAKTVAEAGVQPLMSERIAERQDWAWKAAKALPKEVLDHGDLGALLDGIKPQK